MVRKEISIDVEIQNKSNWLKIFIPSNTNKNLQAFLQNKDGEILRTVTLLAGNNAVDITNITAEIIYLKLETDTETILKEIKIN